jgi:hypothetical protein
MAIMKPATMTGANSRRGLSGWSKSPALAPITKMA